MIKKIWLAAEQPCGKRLKEALGLWLPHYEKEHGKLPAKLREQILAVSAATLDRQSHLDSLNPFALKRTIERKLRAVLRLQVRRPVRWAA